MGTLARTFPTTAAMIAAVVALALASTGCENSVTRPASADFFAPPRAAETAAQPDDTRLTGSATPQSAQQTANAAVHPSLPAAPLNDAPEIVQTKPTPTVVLPPAPTPLPTATPVPFQEWVRHSEILTPGMPADLQDTEWVRDGIHTHEAQAITALSSLAAPDKTPSLSQWLAMPFLQTVEPADNAALQALWSVHENDPDAFRLIMNHSTIGSWIVDQWSPIIAALPGPRQPPRGRYGISEQFIDQLLDPDTVTVEHRTIVLPLAGQVSIAIVRTKPGSEQSIDRLVHAIEIAESFMEEPFPTRHVTLLFADWPEDSRVVAINNHHSLTIGTVLDVGDGSPEASQADYIIAHETAHFYWVGHHDWLDEGAAELIAREATAASSEPFRPEWECGNPDVGAVEDLETLTLHPDLPDYSCNYAMGLQRLIEMRTDMGEAEFMSWLRSQYQERAVSEPGFMSLDRMHSHGTGTKASAW